MKVEVTMRYTIEAGDEAVDWSDEAYPQHIKDMDMGKEKIEAMVKFDIEESEEPIEAFAVVDESVVKVEVIDG